MWTGALSALPSSVPMHPEPVRFTPEQADEVIAAIGDALADTELTIDELTQAIVDRTGPWAGEQTMEAFQDMWPRRRHRHAAAAAPRDPPAALLRRVRRRGSASGAAVPRRSRDPRAYPGGPGRQLPGAARQWRGRWGVAPAALRSEANHHRRTAARADRDATPAARRRGRPGGRGHAGQADADGGHRDGRAARLSHAPGRVGRHASRPTLAGVVSVCSRSV